MRRLVDLLRAATAVLVVCLATEGAEWITVAQGLHRAAWTAATTWQVAALAVLTVVASGAFVLVRRAARDLSRIATAAPQPDWLADALALGVRATRVVGRHRGRALAVIGWADVRVIARVRTHPVAGAGLLAALFALPIVATKIAIEGYPVPLVGLVFGFVTASLFVVVVVVGAYLRVVAPGRVGRPTWLLAVVVACTAAAAAFAFHDSLLAHQRVTGLSAIFFGTGVAAGTVCFALEKLWRFRATRKPI